ncbi:MAG: CAP domain-containing protein [Patescibacteria group bacterium]
MRNLSGAIFLVLITTGAFGATFLYLQNKAPVEFAQKENSEIIGIIATSTPVEDSNTKIVGTLIATSTEVKKVTATPKNIVTPGTLVAPKLTASISPDPLTADGVLFFTNEARLKNGELPPLARNALLNNLAQIKLADMFAKQYFEHISPMGVGPGDLAKTVGYEFVTVGENLALGDFENDEALVEAWMNSPGHRANILNLRYTEIGIAVGKGMYEGNETWLTVQSFGMPLSLCPVLNTAIREKIEKNNVEIASIQSTLDARRVRIESTPQSDPNYNAYVAEYNGLIPSYDVFVALNKDLVSAFNLQVKAYNECISGDSIH